MRNLASNDTWAYVYDAAGRLASVDLNGATQGTHLYNALGQQVSRTVGGGPSAVVTLSVHDLAGNRIAEHDDTGAVLREYIWLDGRPLAVVEGGQTYQLHWDQIGRPAMATDSTGAVVWAASYLPFGGIDQVFIDTLAIEQNLRFPGQWFQAETGLHQNWMRDYDPTTGRYLQADLLGLVDGPSVYGYARQNSLRFTDPRGEFGLIGAAIGAGSSFAIQFTVNYFKYGDATTAFKCVDFGNVLLSGWMGAAGISPIAVLTKGGGIGNAAGVIGLSTFVKKYLTPGPVRIGTNCECKPNSEIEDIVSTIHL